MSEWILEREGYCEKTHLHEAPVFTLCNGLLGVRGFFEEQREGIAGLGGIYMAGLFGRASYEPWAGVGREMVNLPNFLAVEIQLDGQALKIEEGRIADLHTELDLKKGVLTRSYRTLEQGEPAARVTLKRFVSAADRCAVGQEIAIEAMRPGLSFSARLMIDASVTNLNEVSSEPWPVQPGKKQFEVVRREPDGVVVEIPSPEPVRLGLWQRASVAEGRCAACGDVFSGTLGKGERVRLQRMTAVASTLEGPMDVGETARARLAQTPDFDQALRLSAEALARRWEEADVRVESADPMDQLALRYNLFQLMQAAPEHTQRLSIGARGLTGEMYEGCVFWDTEIFMFPFFLYTNPAQARRLLRYRAATLAQAREHAKANWFEGAMYAWQANYLGQEQTPKGVGAYYAVHVTADIAFALGEYWRATGDDSIWRDGGLEMLLETCRFWASRVSVRPDGQYDLMAVRGPNEYDVVVNNNLYTNLMVRANLLLALEVLRRESAGEALAGLALSPKEPALWEEIAQKLVLPFDGEQNLWLEDETYLRRRALDIRAAKHGGKRIIDSTLPYEALPLYQVTKQGDVLLAMKLLPERFTQEQMQTAYRFYQARTAYDSSLAYSITAVMAARLGDLDTALAYFRKTSRLDLDNLQLNTISGLHFANFGGAWQTVVQGFAGMRMREGELSFCPHLPPDWRSLRFGLHYRGTRLQMTLNAQSMTVEMPRGEGEAPLWVEGRRYVLSPRERALTVKKGR